MLDRVFVCPHCGEAGGVGIYPSLGFSRQPGGLVTCIHCTKCCYETVPFILSWELAHRFLRKRVTRIWTDTAPHYYYPIRWKPLFDIAAIKRKSDRVAMLNKLSSLWYSGYVLDRSLKPGAPLESTAMIRFALETAVPGMAVALTLRDFLSWCHANEQWHCFG